MIHLKQQHSLIDIPSCRGINLSRVNMGKSVPLDQFNKLPETHKCKRCVKHAIHRNKYLKNEEKINSKMADFGKIISLDTGVGGKNIPKMLTFKGFMLEKASYHPQDSESQILHHTSAHEFDHFRHLSHFGTVNAARARASDGSQDHHMGDEKNRPVHYAVRLKLGKVHDVDDINDHDPYNVIELLHKHGIINRGEVDKHHDTLDRIRDKAHKKGRVRAIIDRVFRKHHEGDLRDYGPRQRQAKQSQNQHVAKVIKSKGIDTLRYKNNWEDRGKPSYIITHPDQVRVLRRKKVEKFNLEKGKKHLGIGDGG